MLSGQHLHAQLVFMVRIDCPNSEACRILANAKRVRAHSAHRAFFGYLFSAPESPLIRDIRAHTEATRSMMARALAYIDAPPERMSALRRDADIALRDAELFPWHDVRKQSACHAGCAAAELIASYAYPPYLRDCIDSIVKAFPTRKRDTYTYLARLFVDVQGG